MPANTCTWGRHDFTICDSTAKTDWNRVGGVYIFAQRDPDDQTRWFARYVGETESFKKRLSGHEKWNEAAHLGATTSMP